jgi:hypothetical protein
VKDWRETVFDNLDFRIGNWDFGGALVTRRDSITGEWVESEFSFKIKLPKDAKSDCEYLDPADGWDYGRLQKLSGVYSELFRMSSVFIQTPSIFYFSDPVSSQDVRLA